VQLDKKVATINLKANNWYSSQFPIKKNTEAGEYYLQCIPDELEFDTFKISSNLLIHTYTVCSYLDGNKKIQQLILPIALEVVNQKSSNWRIYGGEDGVELYENTDFSVEAITKISEKKSQNTENTSFLLALSHPDIFSLLYGLEYIDTFIAQQKELSDFDAFATSGNPQKIGVRQHKGYDVILPVRATLSEKPN